ncbi:biotin transporter BioY [Arthrobacter sp. 35W]|uniref:biotin transporter BioY n=1 Tax=Arthrobacter sp. 35W TaxID=1132441 RepID=UPI000429EF0E|nr:biotin transporter BioY [Arthrobacter sp. 35W]
MTDPALKPSSDSLPQGEPAAGTTASSAPSIAGRRRWRSGDLALIAVFAALLAASISIPGIPVGGLGVPITLQTLVVALCGLVLGFGRGLAAVGLYILLGLVGLPIFSGFRSGVAVLASPSAGYIIGFLGGVAVTGALAAIAVRTRRKWLGLFGAAIAGMVVIHAFGIAGLALKGMGLTAALAADVVFLPGDILKNVVAVSIALSLHRAFPDILVRRRK